MRSRRLDDTLEANVEIFWRFLIKSRKHPFEMI
jgi:hypothetical protein